MTLPRPEPVIVGLTREDLRKERNAALLALAALALLLIIVLGVALRAASVGREGRDIGEANRGLLEAVHDCTAVDGACYKGRLDNSRRDLTLLLAGDKAAAWCMGQVNPRGTKRDFYLCVDNEVARLMATPTPTR